MRTMNFLISSFIKTANIVVTLEFAKERKRIHGCDMMKCKYCVNDVNETFFDYKVCGDCGEALLDAYYERLEHEVTA